MKRTLFPLILAMSSLFMISCEQCDSVIQRPMESSSFRLFDDLGNDLWFGPSSPFNADSAEVFILNQGLRIQVPTEVQDNPNSTRYVGFTLRPTPGAQQGKVVIHLNETDSVDFFYVTVTDQANCEEYEEISFVLQGDSVLCNRCGIPVIEGGSGEFINLTY